MLWLSYEIRYWGCLQLFMLFSILVCALYCSRIAIYLVANVRDVFWMLMCVLSSIGSWFRNPQANLLGWQLVMLMFLSSGRDMMTILVIQVVAIIVVQFTLLVNVSRSCSTHIGGLHWLLCMLLNIFLVRWCSSCYAAFLVIVSCCRWLRHNYQRCCMFVVLISVQTVLADIVLVHMYCCSLWG